MIKYIHLILYVSCLSTVMQAQNITVRDRESEEVLEFVTIVSQDPQVMVMTNSEGQADFSGFLDAGQIEFQALGYKTTQMSYAEVAELDFNIPLDAFYLNLDEIVVSGTRWRQNSGNIPSKIISISPKEVARLNPQTAADLLGISGKVFIQKSQQGGGSPMIRGFATNRLLYTIDGVRMNSAIFRGGNLQNVISLDPFATEHTEVLFGPGSVIYGSDAIGGVMSFQTLTPTFSLTDKPLVTGKAVLRYSSANREKTGHFDVQVGWKKWAMLTSVTSWDYDHLRQGSHGPDEYIKPYFVSRIDSVDQVVSQEDPLLQIPSAYAQTNVMQKVRFRPSSNWDLEYGFHFSETTSYGRYDRHNRTRNGTARYAEWNYGPQRWMMNALTAKYLTERRLLDQMTIRLAQQEFGESRIDRSLNNNIRNTQTEKVLAWSANLDFTKATGNHTFFYGAEVVTNKVTSTGMTTDISNAISIEGPARYPNSTWTSLAVYINDDWKVNNKMTLQAGLRYNYFLLDADFDTRYYPFPFSSAKVDNGALTGSLGAVFRPSPSWVIKANFGTAFRSPNVDDLGKVFDSEPGAVTVPNPELEAEYAYNFDLGVAKVFGELLKIDLTGYYTILNQAMVRRNDQLNGLDSILYDGELSQVQSIQNAAVAHVYGVQAGIEIALPAGFRFSSDLNFQRGEEELDDGSTSPSRHAAPFFMMNRLIYRTDGLTMEVYTNYQHERPHDELAVEEQGKDEIYAHDASGQTYAPSWYTLNIKASYQLNDQVQLTAGLENITDQRYRPYSSGISGAGRNFVFGVRASF